jgi:hypothetical protein
MSFLITLVGIKTTGEQISIRCHNGTNEYDSKPGAQQLMGVHKVSAFHE